MSRAVPPPTFGVLLRVGRGAAALDRTLRCLLAQTHPLWRLHLLADPPSGPAEAAVLDRHRPGLGARLAGAPQPDPEAWGDLAMLLEAGDEWHPETLARIAGALGAPTGARAAQPAGPVGALAGGGWVADPGDTPQPWPLGGPLVDAAPWLAGMPLPTSAVALPPAVWRALGGVRGPEVLRGGQGAARLLRLGDLVAVPGALVTAGRPAGGAAADPPSPAAEAAWPDIAARNGVLRDLLDAHPALAGALAGLLLRADATAAALAGGRGDMKALAARASRMEDALAALDRAGAQLGAWRAASEARLATLRDLTAAQGAALEAAMAGIGRSQAEQAGGLIRLEATLATVAAAQREVAAAVAAGAEREAALAGRLDALRAELAETRLVSGWLRRALWPFVRIRVGIGRLSRRLRGGG